MDNFLSTNLLKYCEYYKVFGMNIVLFHLGYMIILQDDQITTLSTYLIFELYYLASLFYLTTVCFHFLSAPLSFSQSPLH